MLLDTALSLLLESQKQWDGVQSKGDNGSNSCLYLPKTGLLYKCFNSIPAWRNNRFSRAGQLLSLPTNPSLCAGPHSLAHRKYCKTPFYQFFRTPPASQPPSNTGTIFIRSQRDQFCPGLQHRGDSRTSGFSLDPLRDAKLIADQQEQS